MKRALIYTLILAAAGLFLRTYLPRMSASAVQTAVLALPDFRGWKDAQLVHGSGIEAVVVPSIGRIMDFRLAGESGGPFWFLPEMSGKPVDAAAGEWPNFGGDKTWPAPQSAWPARYPRSWPPPPVFDQSPLTVLPLPGAPGLQMESPVDSATGIKFVRTITPGPSTGQMSVRTAYYKESGDPVEISIWVITQLADPELIATPANAGPEPWLAMSENVTGVEVRDGLVLWRRDAAKAQKIGTSARSLVWVGKSRVLRIDLLLDQESSALFPDKGCSAQIYTNPNPKTYVELETLGPLVTLKPGDLAAATNLYTLTERHSGDDAVQAARRALGLP